MEWRKGRKDEKMVREYQIREDQRVVELSGLQVLSFGSGGLGGDEGYPKRQAGMRLKT